MKFILIFLCFFLGFRTLLPNIADFFRCFHYRREINKYIPLIMGALGVVLNVWINLGITPQILLGGLFSGLASTGMHQVFKNLINKNKEE